MKLLEVSRTLPIPEGVTVEVKGRHVRVKGPRGTLQREFTHMTLDMYLIEEKGQKKLKVDLHSGRRKQLASLRTVVSHVQNLIVGVTKGFQYKMRLVYAHFPININIEGGTTLEIRNFLGDKRVRVVKMLPGVNVARSEGVKDELTITGNSVENVSRSCALISQQCNVRVLDIRKFLDGIYVSEKGLATASD
uniref:Large ribosomal subunit protein uL6 alpha-beta domain-containing protein n=2 Tax=Eukaryota TaxID=2759 RepID=A0A7S3QUB7_DUNTE|mmetsp:Transcript_21529/g.59652  ORF Transcript_21529/g.59652 Transcript_21529/m.59652 type:complete len:192 (+) Transcript_21529:79-654(+)|eukprot:CAMPEP_0202337290 /NCGR_PEP_ID=MMETSP1126-20121109/22_1 /ASSEMBLY_ACC=CAM_ASM_000457 /TAXON_ID=3047 /ORGANISM="Dunaliella tertiolecta, Strain CCMP1320" /LENGTH=191 /DNA_ID=CAMNT_0048927433 /DNA_START=91 /DNA_END=666 /DNA_ORIENTATION=-